MAELAFLSRRDTTVTSYRGPLIKTATRHNIGDKIMPLQTAMDAAPIFDRNWNVVFRRDISAIAARIETEGCAYMTLFIANFDAVDEALISVWAGSSPSRQ
ncbi:MAG: hypothetical protein ACWA49_09725 [Ruegeria sp.]